MVEETGVPFEKKHAYPPGNFPTCPGWDLNLGIGERQLTVSGNALDPTAIRAAPSGERQRTVSGNPLDPTAIMAAPSGERQHTVSGNALDMKLTTKKHIWLK